MLKRPQIIDEACNATGLDDFGGDEWIEGLDVLLAALASEADLNDTGPLVAAGQIGGALATRLRVVDWHRRHPEIDVPVPAPIVILGQPRTGTTILFDLLAQDPSLRAPLTWEVGDPVPPPRSADADDPRIEAAEAAGALTEAVVPGFSAIHPTGARRGQECVAITAGDMRSLQYGTVFRIPAYTQWLLYDAHMTSAYRYHRRFLQLLQSGYTGDRWLLKTPAHQWHLGDLLAAYPDATIIHTHRDPVTVVGSVASLTSVLQRIGSDQTSLPDLAAEWMQYLAVGNDRSVKARADGTVPPGAAIDIQYTDLVADPLGTIAAIYDRLDRELTAGAESAMRSFLADNPGDKHGRHTYRFADTGLDEDLVRARNAGYTAAFDVPID